MAIGEILICLKEFLAIISPIFIGIFLIFKIQKKLFNIYNDSSEEGQKESRIILLKAYKNISVIITIGGLIIITIGILYLIQLIP